ncbi:hypothetical protein [Blastococcus sp. SYSU DS0973]
MGPGTPSPNNESARLFIEWYLASLDNYQGWQIAVARRSFPGRLFMLYPSWGIRPGQVEAAVGQDLSGQTPLELTGKIQEGNDFARFVGGIEDPGVVVYTTWLNADASGDSGTDPRRWSLIKYLTTLAADRPVPLAVSGENGGRDTPAEMHLVFQQARRYDLEALVWAFESDLYGTRYASIGDPAGEIASDRPS